VDQCIAYCAEVGTNIDRVRDKEEPDDDIQQPAGIMTPDIAGYSPSGGAPDSTADFENGTSKTNAVFTLARANGNSRRDRGSRFCIRLWR
jgi:hypothetical protein